MGSEDGKPSTWIREGCAFAPDQAFRKFFTRHPHGACALGAMLLGEKAGWVWAAGEHRVSALYEQSRGYQILSTGPLSCCPVKPCHEAQYRMRLDAAVVHLNDDHKWTREKIADWLEARGL